MYCEQNLWVFRPNLPFWLASVANQVSLVEIMVRFLARRNRAKMPLARPNEPDMKPKPTKKLRLGMYQTQIRPRAHDITWHLDSIHGFWLANCEFGSENDQFYNTKHGNYQNYVYFWAKPKICLARHLRLNSPTIVETRSFWRFRSLNVPLLLGEKPSFARFLHRCRLCVDFPWYHHY